MGLASAIRQLSRTAVGLYPAGPDNSPWGFLQGIFPGATATPPKRGTLDFLRAYESMPWVRAIVAKIAASVAATPWRLYAVKPRGSTKAIRDYTLQGAGFEARTKLIAMRKKAGELYEVETHPLLQLFDKSNSYLTGLQTRKVTQAYLELVGEAFWIKERNVLGMPIGVWPLPPNWVVTLPTPSFRFYRVAYKAWQGAIPETEITFIHDPTPQNPYERGAGPAQALSQELDIEDYSARTILSFFYNRARPDLLIHGPGLKPENTARLEQDWLDKNQGFWRMFKPMFVSGDIKVDQISQTFDQMKLVPLREHERDTIISIWGIPPEIMGIRVAATSRSSIQASEYHYARWVLVPRLEFMRSLLQERLVPEYDDRLILDYVSPIAEDQEQELKVMTAAPWAFSVDDWRGRGGLADLPNGRGQVLMVPINLSPEPVDDAGESPDSPAADNAGGEPTQLALAGKPKLLALPAPLRKAKRSAYPAHRAADRMAPKVKKEFVGAVHAQRKAVHLGALERAIAGRSHVAALDALNLKGFADRLSGMQKLIGQTLHLGGDMAAKDLHHMLGKSLRRKDAPEDPATGFSFDVTNPEAVAWIKEHAGELISNISDDTEQSIRSVLTSLFTEKNVTPADAAKLIAATIGPMPQHANAPIERYQSLVDGGMDSLEAYDEAEKYADKLTAYRADVIASTESLTAAHQGKQQLWSQASGAGLIDKERTRKIWIITDDEILDENVCAPMPEMDENQDVGIDENFTTGEGEEIDQPPAHPGCRCDTGLMFDRDSSGGDEE